MTNNNSPGFRDKWLTESTVGLLILIVSILGTVIPLHLWTVSTINESHRHAQEVIAESSRNTQATLTAIAAEMKDFHGRLCAIEARRADNE